MVVLHSRSQAVLHRKQLQAAQLQDVLVLFSGSHLLLLLLLLLAVQAFLSPFGLGIYADSTVSADNTNGNIAGTRAAAAATKVLLACTDKNR